MHLLEELKRRKVVRVGLVYGAVAFAVLQAAELLTDVFGLPQALLTGIGVLLIVGFPVALVLGWAFEVTPDGVKRTPTRTADEPAAHPRWISVGTAFGAGLLLGLGILMGALARNDDAAEATSTLRDRTAIAVLPFRALGAAPSDPFTDGVNEDIRVQLNRIAGLRVTSRTSVSAYAGSEATAAEIGSQLGVGSILEGTVQRTSDRVRLSVTLIDTNADRQLWSEAFDRELTAENVFAIQSEIARAVASALETTLTSDAEVALRDVPTRNLRALEHFYRARHEFLMSNTPSREIEAAGLLETAIEEDPAFVAAWAELTRVRSWMIRTGATRDTLPAFQALERTRTLAPGGPEALVAEGYYRYYALGDWQGALDTFQRVEDPDVDVRRGQALVLRRLGRIREGLDTALALLADEPRDVVTAQDIWFTHLLLGNHDAALAMMDLARELGPESSDAFNGRIAIAVMRDDTARVRSLARAWRDAPGAQNVAASGFVDAWLDHWSGADSARVLRQLREIIGAGGFRGLASFARYTWIPTLPPPLHAAAIAYEYGDRAQAVAWARMAAEDLLGVGRLTREQLYAERGPDRFGVRAHLLLTDAWSAFFEGRADEARRLADRAVAAYPIERDPPDAAHYVRARALLRVWLGDEAGAREDLRWVESSGLSPATAARFDPLWRGVELGR
jgi:TolB-like protein